MNQNKTRFDATILRPAKLSADGPPAFVVLPKDASKTLPRRGRTTVLGAVNGYGFQTTLEPDGQLSHWLPLNDALLAAAKVNIGELATFEIAPVAQEPEPAVPADLQEALAAAPAAHTVWMNTTTIARVDWIHWVTSAKQPATRAKRIRDACDKLACGKRRVCCFDPSGYYSRALSAPKAAD